MHISEAHNSRNTILTKCSKMTEENQKIHGMNGNADGNIKEECPKSGYVQGGRLKFFKDGKFILELERAREGERVSWVSVPRKTFWPPQGTAASTPTYRQESSTSLSVSDDNSSIQSSPWQRDHSWKQTNPRRNLSKEMTLFWWMPKPKRRQMASHRSKKRRRPYSTAAETFDQSREKTSSPGVNKEGGSPRSNNVNNNNNHRKGGKGRLLFIVQSLIDKNCRTSTPPRCEMVVSPRKRFLREMEKDRGAPSEESSNCLKRSRSKPQSAPSPSAQLHSPAKMVASPVQVNGGTDTEVKQPPRNCSYSITSLLAEDRNLRRSPSNSPSHFSPQPMQQQAYRSDHAAAPPAGAPTDDRLYSESVDRLRSIELSQVDKRVGYGPPPPPAYPPAPPSHHPHHPHHHYLPHYMYPFPVAPFYNAGVYGARGGYMVPPAPYHYPGGAPSMHLPPHHAAPNHGPPTARHDVPTAPWPTVESAVGPPSISSRDAMELRDETVVDMPLNLSKHAG